MDNREADATAEEVQRRIAWLVNYLLPIVPPDDVLLVSLVARMAAVDPAQSARYLAH